MEKTVTTKQVRAAIALAGAIALFPFAINNFLQGRVLLGCTSGLLSLTLFFSAWQLNTRGRLLTGGVDILILAALASLVSVQQQGVVGMMWCFPVLLAAHFLLGRYAALWVAGSFLVAATVIAGLTVGWSLAARFGATLGLVSAFATSFCWRIQAQRMELESVARHDPLTGVFNRRYLDEWYPTIASHGPVAMLIDIDHFKRINDEYGHDAGDRILLKVTNLVLNQLGLSDEAFRLGGDEFVVVMPRRDINDAARIAHRIRAAVARDPNLACEVTVSIGLSEAVPDESIRSLLKRCDHAMYRAKRRGGDSVQLTGGLDWSELKIVANQ